MNRSRLSIAAALTAPALAALLAPRLGIGSAPRSAQARESAPAAAPAIPVLGPGRPTGEQVAALERVAQIGEAGGVESPFLEATEEIVPAEVAAAEQVPAWAERLSRQANLSSVFGSPRGDAAVINGKIYFRGAEVVEGVTIESIDVAGRSVIVVISGGERYQLTMAARREDPTVVTKLD